MFSAFIGLVLMFSQLGFSQNAPVAEAVADPDELPFPYNSQIPGSADRVEPGKLSGQFFIPSFFRVAQRNIEVIEQGHRVHPWAMEALDSDGAFSRLLSLGGHSLKDINALHISHLSLVLESNSFDLRNDGSTVYSLPVLFSIGVEISPTPGANKFSRLTMEVVSLLELVVNKEGSIVSVDVLSYRDSNRFETTGRKYLQGGEFAKKIETESPLLVGLFKPYEKIMKFYNFEFAKLVGSRVLTAFLGNTNSPKEGKQMLEELVNSSPMGIKLP